MSCAMRSPSCSQAGLARELRPARGSPRAGRAAAAPRARRCARTPRRARAAPGRLRLRRPCRDRSPGGAGARERSQVFHIVHPGNRSTRRGSRSACADGVDARRRGPAGRRARGPSGGVPRRSQGPGAARSRCASSTCSWRWCGARADRFARGALRDGLGRALRPDDRSVDVYVHKLRVKLARRCRTAFIHTHFGFGYRFAAGAFTAFHNPRRTASVHASLHNHNDEGRVDENRSDYCGARHRCVAGVRRRGVRRRRRTRPAAAPQRPGVVGGDLSAARSRSTAPRRSPRSPRPRPSCSTRRTRTCGSRSASPAPAAASRSSAPARPTSPTPRGRSTTRRRSRSARRTASSTPRSRSPTTASPS